MGGVSREVAVTVKSAGTDPFRTPGSKYEDEEPFVLALVPAGVPFDWSTEAEDALWLPEPFFYPLYRAGIAQKLPLLSGLNNFYERYRFNSARARELAEELQSIPTSDLSPELQRAIELAAELAGRAASSGGAFDLLVEGP